MTSRMIRWNLRLASSPEKVWQLLTTDSGRQRFWCEASKQTDDTIKMKFNNGWEEDAVVLEASAPHRFKLKYFGTPVTFVLRPDERGGTDLELRHEEVRQGIFEAVLPGWLNVLFPLKAFADFGVDLRNRDRTRTWDDGYADG